MLKKRFFMIVFSPVMIFFILNGCTKTDNNLVYNKGYIAPIKKSRKKLFFHMTTNYIPGASIAVSVDQKTIWSEGVGMSNKELKVPATRQTKFRIGGVSQLFTTLIYHLMLEQGTIDGNEIVGDYIPAFANKKYPISLKQLIYQTSGIRQPTKKETYKAKNYMKVAASLSIFSNDTLLFEPGLYEYESAFNYNLLGAVLEKIEGEDFKIIVDSMILDTLHLGNTTPDHIPSIIENRSSIYDQDFIGRIVNAFPTNNYHNLPSLGYLSTSEDLLKLGNALLKSNYFSDSLKNRMFQNYKLKNGDSTKKSCGWNVYNSIKDSSAFYTFRGLTIGGSAELLIHPKQNLVIVMEANMDDELGQLPTLKIWNNFSLYFHGELKEE